MAKFEVKLKLTGLELEIKGEREDIPRLTSSLSEQIAGALRPTALIAQAKEPEVVHNGTVDYAHPKDSAETKRRRKPARQHRAKDGDAADTAAVLDWVHDPAKWGSPQQGWSVAEKSLWLLHVVAGEKQLAVLSGPSIAATFNRHFRQAGPVHPPLVTRELGKLKSVSPALVGEDTTVDPSTWFLTQEGSKRAEELVNQAKGTNPPV
jgi:hypothetical protein